MNLSVIVLMRWCYCMIVSIQMILCIFRVDMQMRQGIERYQEYEIRDGVIGFLCYLLCKPVSGLA